MKAFDNEMATDLANIIKGIAIWENEVKKINN